MKKIAFALAATMVFSALAPTLAEARPGKGYRAGKGVVAYRGGGPRYYGNRGYRRGNVAAGAAAVGIAGALIGGAIAASNRPRYYYDEPAPVYGYPAYGYPAYGYGPRGYYGY